MGRQRLATPSLCLTRSRLSAAQDETETLGEFHYESVNGYDVFYSICKVTFVDAAKVCLACLMQLRSRFIAWNIWHKPQI